MGEEHWLGSGPWRLSWQVEWTDHSCLWECLRTAGWCSEHNLSLCTVFCTSSNNVHLPHRQKRMASFISFLHPLSSCTQCSLALMQPLLKLKELRFITVVPVLQPDWFPLPRVRLPTILHFTVPVSGTNCSGAGVALRSDIGHEQGDFGRLSQIPHRLFSQEGRDRGQFGSSCINGTQYLVNSRHRSSGRFSDQAIPAAYWGEIHSVSLHHRVLKSC